MTRLTGTSIRRLVMVSELREARLLRTHSRQWSQSVEVECLVGLKLRMSSVGSAEARLIIGPPMFAAFCARLATEIYYRPMPRFCQLDILYHFLLYTWAGDIIDTTMHS